MIASIYLIGIAQGLLLSITFFKKGASDNQYYWLGSLILTVTIMISGQWLLVTDRHTLFPLIFLLASGLIFCIGPLLYLFIKLKIEGTLATVIQLLLHMIPAILFYLLIASEVYPFTSDQLQQFVGTSISTNDSGSLPVIVIIKSLHILIYTLLSFLLLRKEKNIKQLHMLWSFVVGYLILQGVSWGTLITSMFSGSRIMIMADNVMAILLVVYVYLLGYISVKTPNFLNFTSKTPVKKYTTTGLDSNDSQQLYNELTMLMEKESPFLDPGLTLKQLAGYLSIKPHHLSQIINENSESNFSDFVNFYRIEKVKELMFDPGFSNYTLLAIAFESGFNNKNSFNIAFKKLTGQTPTAFRKAG